MAGETLTGVFSDIADAVRAKGVTGQMTPLQMPAKITSIPSGGETPEAEWKDVNFIDYDGKNLYSYTTTEALALTELPPAPDRTSKGLQFQEWNYTLEEVKANASDTGKCTAGATYTTTDGKTHLKITIWDEQYSNIPICYWQNTVGGVEVDWGDGSEPEINTDGSRVQLTHQYIPQSFPAYYDITIDVKEGSINFETEIFGHSSWAIESATSPKTAWSNILTEVHFGNNVNSCSAGSFGNKGNLDSITISKGVTNLGNLFGENTRFKSIVIPSGLN